MSTNHKNAIFFLTLAFGCALTFISAYAGTISSVFSLIGVILLFGVIFFYALLQNIEVGILLITFLLPFEQIGGMDIGGMNVRLSQVVFVATFAAWVIGGLFRKSLKININLNLALIAFFIASCVLSLPNSVNMGRSIQIFIFILFTFIVYFFFSSIKLTEELMGKIIRTLLISMIVTCAFGLFQFAGDMIGLPRSTTGLEETYTKAVFGFPRIQSTANEPLNFANYLIMPLSLLFAFFASGTAQTQIASEFRKVSIPLLAFGGVILVLTFSRGGWGGLALSFLIIGLAFFHKLINIRNIIIGIAGLTIIIGGVFITAKLTNAPFTLDALISRINVSDFSAKHRIQTTNEGLAGWEKSKWIGIGIGSYGPFVAKFPNVRPENGWQTVNNEYAELLIETGIIGLSIMIILWGNVFIGGLLQMRDSNSLRKIIRLGLLAAFAGMLLQYISFSTLYVFHFWYLIGLLSNKYFFKDIK